MTLAVIHSFDLKWHAISLASNNFGTMITMVSPVWRLVEFEEPPTRFWSWTYCLLLLFSCSLVSVLFFVHFVYFSKVVLLFFPLCVSVLEKRW